MSKKYSGGVLSKTVTVPTGPYQDSAASGMWSMEDVVRFKQQGVWPTAGLQPNSIEDVFSTYLYTGNGSVQSISNGINLGSTYGGSGYFGGATAASGLTAPASTSWQLTGDYTVEAWIYVVTLANGTIYATGGSGAADQFTYTAAGELYFANQGTGTGVITAGSWIHVAAARSGTTQKIFVNGVVQSTTTVSGTIGQNATAYIGMRVDTTNYVTGYISNLRVVNGTAVYTSNFTPSTVPLTAITNTVLLTCQANGFVDASTNAFTITNSGAIATTNYGPFTSATAGKGGLVWTKSRSAATHNYIQDTVTGTSVARITNSDSPDASGITGRFFNTDGFTLDGSAAWNANAATFVSWTFRKQPKFFDVVTYTGNGNNSRMVSHNLGSVPGCIIVKRTSSTSNWFTWHIASGITTSVTGFQLNTTAAATTTGYDVSTDITSTQFRAAAIFDSLSADPNVNGSTYVAYLFAHDAGGFGPTGTDNVISCGSFTSSAGGLATVNLGYEPQWVIVKGSSGAAHWQIMDTMRGFVVGAANANSKYLNANSSSAELDTPPYGLTNTGFDFNGAPSVTFIYIAIRRGPMKVPTTGTSVFKPLSRGAQSIPQLLDIGFPTDLAIGKETLVNGGWIWGDRLRGANYLQSNNTNTEGVGPVYLFDQQNYLSSVWNSGAETDYAMRRAPGFFDVVCYTGTGASTLTVTHNLQAVPELLILKYRQGTSYGWKVTAAGLTNPNQYYLNLNGTQEETNYTSDLIYNRTSTTFTVNSDLAQSGFNWVTYLFATCAGVSKVGSYTGTGTTKQIDCGFTGGARFVLIKRTDSTGDWYVWDTARGIVAGNDPYLLLNSSAGGVTNTDYIDTYSAGFELSSTAPAAINANGGTYIFLAIA